MEPSVQHPHEFYMRRALHLAANARGYTSPNPMVGCVIVARGQVIGEGFHRRCGGPHAEVWAVRSVPPHLAHLLTEATVYVTLEPCSHYGKTPPCADMLVSHHVAHVVVGCTDPNPSVAGRGIEKLRQAGIKVTVGVLEKECLHLNRPFITRQLLHRPYILLKWAQSADGYMDMARSPEHAPCRFSTRLSLQAMHKLRASVDAIMVGADTVIADNPSLTLRYLAGRRPRPVIVDRRGRVPADAKLFSAPSLIYFTSRIRPELPPAVTQIVVPADASPQLLVSELKALSVSSVIIEGGATLLRSFIAEGLWDDARIEIAPFSLAGKGVAPAIIPRGVISIDSSYPPNSIINVKNPSPLAF